MINIKSLLQTVFLIIFIALFFVFFNQKIYAQQWCNGHECFETPKGWGGDTDPDAPAPPTGGGSECTNAYVFRDNPPYQTAPCFVPGPGDVMGGHMTIAQTMKGNWHDGTWAHSDCCNNRGVQVYDNTSREQWCTGGNSGMCSDCLSVRAWAPVTSSRNTAISTLFTMPGKLSDNIKLKLNGSDRNINSYLARKPEDTYNSNHTVFRSVPYGADYEFTWKFWTSFSGRVGVKALNATKHARQRSTKAELYSWNGSDWREESIGVGFGSAEHEDRDCHLNFNLVAFRPYKLILKDKVPSGDLLAFLLLSKPTDPQRGSRVSYIPLKYSLNMLTGSVNLTERENPTSEPPSVPAEAVNWNVFCKHSSWTDWIEAGRPTSSTFACVDENGFPLIPSGSYEIKLETPVGYKLAGMATDGYFLPDSSTSTVIDENTVAFEDYSNLQDTFGSMGNVYKNQKEGLIPLYRKRYLPDLQFFNYHMTTTDVDEKNDLYKNPSIIGYIKPPNPEERIPLARYRCKRYSSAAGAFYFVIHGGKKLSDYGILSNNCQYLGIVGYGYRNGGAGRTPLYLRGNVRQGGDFNLRNCSGFYCPGGYYIDRVAYINTSRSSNKNLALGKPVAVDSTYGSYIAQKAVDGTEIGNGTRWVSRESSSPHWIEIDLGSRQTVGSVKFYSGYIYSIGTYKPTPAGMKDPLRNYKIQIWDGSRWVDVASQKNNTSPVVFKSFTPVTTDRVRLYTHVDKRIRLFEIEIYAASSGSDRVPLYSFQRLEKWQDDSKYRRWHWQRSWLILYMSTTDFSEKHDPINWVSGGFVPVGIYGYLEKDKGSSEDYLTANDIPLYRYKCLVAPCRHPTPRAYFVSDKSSYEDIGYTGICDPNCIKEEIIGYAFKRATSETKPLYLNRLRLGGCCDRTVFNATYGGDFVTPQQKGNKIASVYKETDFYLYAGKGTISGNVYQDDEADTKNCNSPDLQKTPLTDNWTVKCSGGSIEGGSQKAKIEGNKYTCCAEWLTVNKALGKQVTADSIYRPENTAEKAVDGNITDDSSRWVSADSPPVKISIWAQGTPAYGIGPRMTLYVEEDGVFNKKADWHVWINYQEYTYTLAPGVNPSRIRIGFDNDYWWPPYEDRNLKVDKIVVDGVTYQTEDPLVYSVGVWDAATDCNPGYKQSEWLACNGYFQYPVQASTVKEPHWLEVDFGKEEEIDRVKFWIGYQGYNNPISSYKIQKWDGSNWQDVISRQRAEGFTIVDESFEPVETSKIRFWSDSGEIVRMYEFEAHGKANTCQSTELGYGDFVNVQFYPEGDYSLKKSCLEDSPYDMTSSFQLNESIDGSGPDFYAGINIEDSWFQVEGGDVHANNGSIVSPIPGTCTGSCVPNLILDKTSSPLAKYGVASLNNGNFNAGEGTISWQAKSGEYKGKRYDYGFWKKELSSRFEEGEWDGTPNEEGLWKKEGDITIESATVADKIFVLVNGKVAINGDIIVQDGGSLVIVASGDINIDGGVGKLQGYYITDGTIRTGAGNEQLEVQGGLIGFTNVLLERDLESGNNTQPAEKFIFRSDIYLNLPEIKINEIAQWEEVAP